MQPAANDAEPGHRPSSAATAPVDRPARTRGSGPGPAVPEQRPAPDLGPVTADPPATTGAGPPALTEREREILAFEGRWWKRPGAKEQAIRDTFEVTATRYYQQLNALLDNPAALAADPVLVGRLRRLRAAGTRSRRR